MNVGDMEEDFEELYDLYGDNMRMHPLVRIPMRTCMMVYMVHLTNQMAMKAPVPNIQEILRTNPDIARQMANEAMKTQTQQFRQQSAPQPQQQQQFQPSPPPPAPSNPLSGLMSFLGATNPPPPPASTKLIPQAQPVKKVSMPTRSMPAPQMPSFLNTPTNNKPGLSNLLSNIKAEKQQQQQQPPTPKLKSALKKSPSSTATKSPKNSVVIKL
jgi:hypothetical protein